MVGADPRAAARRGAGAQDLAALEPRRGRRLGNRPRSRGRGAPAGRGILVGAADQRDHRLPATPVRARVTGVEALAAKGPPSGRHRAARQAGGAVVVRARLGAAPPDTCTDGTRRHARPVRNGPAPSPLGRGNTPCAVLRGPGQALRHRRRPDDDDVDRRSGRRSSRAARGPEQGGARARARAASRRGRPADSRRLGSEDRRRACLPARAPGRDRRDARAAVVGATRSTSCRRPARTTRSRA